MPLINFAAVCSPSTDIMHSGLEAITQLFQEAPGKLAKRFPRKLFPTNPTAELKKTGLNI